MGSSFYSISLTGLNAAQAGLVTTSHNIANAGTAGYSRQSVLQTTNGGTLMGNAYFGEGTNVQAVQRAYNGFLNEQVLAADTRFNEYDTYSTQISEIDNMLADASVGMTPAMQSFFSGIQEVAANPSSIPARQSMLSSAQTMTARFHNLSDRINEVSAGVEGEIADTVSSISTYAKSIANLNAKIMVAEQGGAGPTANDMQDQRDQLITQLNQLTKVTASKQADGTMSIFIGTGQALVMGAKATTLVTRPSADNPQQLAVNSLSDSGTAVPIPETLLSGGKLGGLLSVRSGALATAQNQLGLVAVGLASTINDQHKLGQDLNGNLGTNMFTLPDIPVKRSANSSTTTPAPTVSYGDVSKLTGDDYQLTFTSSSGAYRLTRVSDGSSVNAAAVGLSISPPSSATVGDSFLIQPTSTAAANIAVAITDTRMVAAAAPITAARNTANLGTATITAPSVSSTASLASFGTTSAPTTLTYSGGNLSGFPAGLAVSYTPLGGSTVTASAPVTSIPYSSGMTISLGGVSFTMSGAPQNNDKFTLGPNTNGVSDSRNAVALGKIQTSKTMLSASGSPSATIQSVYSQMVSNVGNQTREVEANRDAQQALLEQASQAKQSVAGVNLDEEAANLLRYQQAYQAAGKVMSLASKLFEQVLSIG
jgi:flagellar hook-associated protein 1